MRLLSELLLFPITAPVRGLRFVLDQIMAEVEAAYLDESRVEGALIELSLRHDTGQVSGEEYQAQETALLEQLDAIRAYKEALLEQYVMEQEEYQGLEYYTYEHGGGPQ
jgi:hypothetical protein